MQLLYIRLGPGQRAIAPTGLCRLRCAQCRPSTDRSTRRSRRYPPYRLSLLGATVGASSSTVWHGSCVAPAVQMQLDSGMDEAMVFIGFFEVLSESPSAPSLRLRLRVLPSLLFSDRGAHPPAQCAASTGPAIRSAHAITEELHAVAQSAPCTHARAHTHAADSSWEADAPWRSQVPQSTLESAAVASLLRCADPARHVGP